MIAGIAAFALGIGVFALSGVVIQSSWSMLVVPAWHLEPITYAAALVLLFMARLVTARTPRAGEIKNDKETEATDQLAHQIGLAIAWVVVWGCAWVLSVVIS